MPNPFMDGQQVPVPQTPDPMRDQPQPWQQHQAHIDHVGARGQMAVEQLEAISQGREPMFRDEPEQLSRDLDAYEVYATAPGEVARINAARAVLQGMVRRQAGGGAQVMQGVALPVPAAPQSPLGRVNMLGPKVP